MLYLYRGWYTLFGGVHPIGASGICRILPFNDIYKDVVCSDSLWCKQRKLSAYMSLKYFVIRRKYIQ